MTTHSPGLAWKTQNSKLRIQNSRPKGASYQVGEDAISSSAANTLSGRENQKP